LTYSVSRLVDKYLESSRVLAISKGHKNGTVWHLLDVIVRDHDPFWNRLCNLINIHEISVGLIEANFSTIPQMAEGEQNTPGPDLLDLMGRAYAISQNYQSSSISIEHMILALAEAPGTTDFFAAHRMNKLKIKAAVDTIKKAKISNGRIMEEASTTLQRFAKDLTQLAFDNKIDPVIGRDDEIRRAIQVLCRRTKNNPVLIGEPGVGKTAIAEGLALRIIRGDVPDSLRQARVYTLDLGALVAGTQYRGEFEERMNGLLKDLSAQAGQIILFIDELHTLVGAGKADGAMDASNMLKPALARGELHCIGATTLDEYRKYIEKDAALARRFQPIYVTEPSVEDAISILRGLKERYEVHHGVRISDSAIVAACQLSHRYIADRFLPDKAIDLIDEAAARLRMMTDSKPEEVDHLSRKLLQLQIEKQALEKETDTASKQRLGLLTTQIAEITAEFQEKSQAWEIKRGVLQKIRTIKQDLDMLKNELEVLQREGTNLSRAGEIMYSRIPQKEAELRTVLDDHPDATEAVSPEDVARVVSRWTGVPVEKMVSSESEKLIQMEQILAQDLIGQTAAVEAVANAVRRTRAGIQDPNRPMASFLFLGPTGVGKTQLCKVLAEFLFDDANALTRFDMSEYMEKHSISRLIGAPPGYVGYEEGGQLTEKVRRRPYSVILFDEIEKAHPDIFNILLQVLDDGRLTDSQKRTVDFKNTIIVMTSNIGAEHLLESEEINDKVRAEVISAVQRTFRPEFINRLDEIVVFDRLKKAEIQSIAKLELTHLQQRLDTQNIVLNYGDDVLAWLGEHGYDPIYGARPLKRLIQRVIENPLAMAVLKENITPGQEVIFKLTVKDDQIVVGRV
jgi:ATP-dependent Clp protease ATP-binding subunit ClpB